MDNIIEVVPDDIPAWAKKAMDEGQFFNVACESMRELERLRSLLKNEHVGRVTEARVVVYGGLSDGLKGIVGPFWSEEQAETYMEAHNLGHYEKFIEPLESPDDKS